MIKKGVCRAIAVRYVFVPNSRRIPVELVTSAGQQEKKMDNLLKFNKELVEGNYKILNTKQPASNLTGDESKPSKSLLNDVLSNRISYVARRIINDDEFLTRYLIVQKDWNPIIEKLLSQQDILLELPSSEISSIFTSAIYKLNWSNIMKVDQFLCRYYANDLKMFSPKNYDCLFKNIGQLEPLYNHKSFHTLGSDAKKHYDLDKDLPYQKINELLRRYALIAEDQDAKSQNRILHYCLNYVCKLNSISAVNKILSFFKVNFNLLPNRTIYSKLIQFCSNLRLYDRAMDLFDTLKFLSMEHQPDINAYNAILNVCEQTQNYPKALDLLQEMKEKNLVPSEYTISKIVKLFAKTSQNNISAEGKKELLRLIGWKVLVPTLQENKLRNIENIMTLAAYDGDANLCRALYFQFTMRKFVEIRSQGTIDDRTAWSKAFNPILFNYLLLAYSNWENYKIPLITMFDEGNKYRNDLLNDIDYTTRSFQDCSVILPLLPLKEISNSNDILLESAALWHFHLNRGQTDKDYLTDSVGWESDTFLKLKQNSGSLEEFKSKIFQLLKEMTFNDINTSILNYRCLNTYLTIPVKLGSKKDFVERLNTYTVDITDLNVIFEKLYENPLDEQLSKDLIQSEHKLLVNCWTYELMMKAAIKFKDSQLAQRTWKKRGLFRMTHMFLNLPKNERVKRDSKFAKITLDFFVEKRELQDALRVVLSSKYFVDWTFQDVKKLYVALTDLEDKDSLHHLRNAISKKDRIKKLEREIEELSI